MKEKNHFSLYAVFIWFLAILFYFYEFFLRVLPATIASNIIESLDMTLEQFAILGSAYYITYSFMQIPVGILLDRLTIKLLVILAVGSCAFGMLWFSFSGGFVVAFICRLFIGLGSSFGFISLMIVTLNWFPKKYFAFLIGCGQFLGAIGPLVAGAPIALILKKVNGDWRIIFFWVAMFGILLTVCFALFFKGKPPQSKDRIVFVDRENFLFKRIKSLLRRFQIWMIVLYSATVYVSLPLLGAFWGTTYMELKGLSKPKAALMISMIWIGLAVGCPIFGKLSDLIKRRKPIIILSSVIGIIGSVFFLFFNISNIYYLAVVFFLIGLAGSGQNLSFVIISEQAPASLRATALGLNNTFLMGIAAILPPFVTSIIRHFARGEHLTTFALEKGLLVIPICFIVAFLISTFGVRETFCRHQNVIHQVQKE